MIGAGNQPYGTGAVKTRFMIHDDAVYENKVKDISVGPLYSFSRGLILLKRPQDKCLAAGSGVTAHHRHAGNEQSWADPSRAMQGLAGTPHDGESVAARLSPRGASLSCLTVVNTAALCYGVKVHKK